MALKVMSFKLPIGVETRYSLDIIVSVVIEMADVNTYQESFRLTDLVGAKV